MSDFLKIEDNFGDGAYFTLENTSNGQGVHILSTTGPVVLNETARRKMVIYLMATLPEYSQVPPPIRRKPVFAWWRR